MAESNVPVTSGSGNNVDTFTLASTGNKRQSVVIGDSSVDGNVAPVQSTDPVSNVAGVVVRDVNTSAIVSRLTTGTIQIFIPDTGHTLGKVDAGVGTFNVKLDPGYTLGKVDAGIGTFSVFFSPSTPAVNVAAWFGSTAPTVGSKISANSVPIVVASDQATVTVKLDPGYTLGKMDAGAGTFNVSFSPSTPAVLANTSATIIIPLTVSGQANGVSVSGNTLIAPTTGRTFKVYAYSITTTGVTSILAKFTNGAGTGPTEYWRLALQSPSGVASGANFGVTPPGYLFASSNGGTISLVLDSGTLVHYSVAYFEESS